MIELLLVREPSTPNSTMGVLTVDGHTFYSVEDPWHDNKPFGSCIPEGVYALVRHNTPAHPDTWAMVNPSLQIYHQPGNIPASQLKTARFACLIHAGNSSKDVEGCIAIGLKRDKETVLSSRAAMDAFRAVMEKYSMWNLRITHA